MKRDDRNPQKKPLGNYLRYYHAGFELFAAVGLLTWGGWWLDRRFGTSPWWTLVGLALGFGGGFRALYREVYGAAKPGASARPPESPDASKAADSHAVDSSASPEDAGDSRSGGPDARSARDREGEDSGRR